MGGVDWEYEIKKADWYVGILNGVDVGSIKGSLIDLYYLGGS